MNLSSRVRRCNEVKTTLLPDGYIALVHRESNLSMIIPPMAALAWEFCDGEMLIELIVEEILNLVEVENRESLEAEVLQLFNELARDEFLKVLE